MFAGRAVALVYFFAAVIKLEARRTAAIVRVQTIHTRGVILARFSIALVHLLAHTVGGLVAHVAAAAVLARPQVVADGVLGAAVLLVRRAQVDGRLAERSNEPSLRRREAQCGCGGTPCWRT